VFPLLSDRARCSSLPFLTLSRSHVFAFFPSPLPNFIRPRPLLGNTLPGSGVVFLPSSHPGLGSRRFAYFRNYFRSGQCNALLIYCFFWAFFPPALSNLGASWVSFFGLGQTDVREPPRFVHSTPRRASSAFPRGFVHLCVPYSIILLLISEKLAVSWQV